MMKKILYFFCLLIPYIFLLCDAKNNTLRIGINTFPISLNPVYVTDETSQGVINKVFDSLFYFDEKGKLEKCLVRKYTFLIGRTEIVIELKKRKFFSDGKELDADDVLSTINLLKNKMYHYPYQSTLVFIKKLEKINQHTFKIFLKYKLATWKNLLTFKILNSKEIEAVTPPAFKNSILSGTGPYRIDKIKEPGRIFLAKNKFYKNKSIYQFIEYMVISSTHLEPLKLLKGEVDICELQPEHAEVFNKISTWKEKFEILKYKKFGFTYLVFNLNNRWVTKNVRNIFYNRLIVEDFLKRFLRQKGERVRTPFLLLNNLVKPTRLFSKELKTEIRLKVLTNSESKLRKEFVLFLKKELKHLNIVLEPIFLEYHTFLKYIKKGNFDLAVSGFLLDIDYDMKDVFYSDSYFNYANFKNTKMDELLDRGLIELNPEKRLKIYQQANKIWLEELPLIPLFNLYYYMGVSRRVTIPGNPCQIMGSTGDFLLNIEDWKVN